MTRSRTLRRYEAALNAAKEHQANADAIRLQLANNCQHERTRQFKQDNDDGYGKWWTTTVTQCQLCGQHNTYGNWYTPSYD